MTDAPTDMPTTSALVPLHANEQGWTCSKIQMVDDDQLLVRFGIPDSSDCITVTVLPRSAPAPVFRRLTHVAVRYDGRLSQRTSERLEQVATIVAQVGASIDSRIQALADDGEKQPISIARALGRDDRSRTVVFGRDCLRGLLAPIVEEGVPVSGGWVLGDIYPSSYFHQAATPVLRLILDFRRDSDGRAFRMEVGPIDGSRSPFARSTHLSLGYLSPSGEEPEGVEVLCTLVAFVLQLQDHEGLDFEFPDVESDVEHALLTHDEPEETRSEKVLNLAIDSGCEQSCVFCSIGEIAPPHDDGARILPRLLADLRSNRESGVTAVRINGYDPLRYSHIMDVLECIFSLGYQRVDVFSPCTVLSDLELCKSVTSHLPSQTVFNVPLYGVEAAVHDKVVGKPGAFDRVMKAIDNLLKLRGPEVIRVATVITHESKDSLLELASFANQRRLGFSAHFPFPSFESRRDRFFTSAPRQVEVADAIVSSYVESDPGEWALRSLFSSLSGLAPCVLLRRAGRKGISAKAWLIDNEQNKLAGTEYREDKIRHRSKQADHAAFSPPTIECPHSNDCVLLQACCAEFLRSYVELYGLEEFHPVSLAELLASA